MELEKQVCREELAQKLKVLGVPQESLWWWVKEIEEEGYYLQRSLTKKLQIISSTVYPDFDKCSAFTGTELGELLKEADGRFPYYLQFHKLWAYDIHRSYRCADTEANARALWLIYLLENNLITLEAK